METETCKLFIFSEETEGLNSMSISKAIKLISNMPDFCIVDGNVNATAYSKINICVCSS